LQVAAEARVVVAVKILVVAGLGVEQLTRKTQIQALRAGNGVNLAEGPERSGPLDGRQAG
jgi:hypothetical protein